MQEKSWKFKPIRAWLPFGVPLCAVLASAFLPLRPLVRQGMIGVILVWFQVGLLLGIFHG